MPRTWPSMRRRRARQELCVFGFMTLTLYPPRVYITSTFLRPSPPRRGVCFLNETIDSSGKTQDHTAAVDPVCGMTVDPAKTAHRAEYGGRSWYFCCAGCRSKFLAEPARFAEVPKPSCFGHGHHARSSREAAPE